MEYRYSIWKNHSNKYKHSIEYKSRYKFQYTYSYIVYRIKLY